MKTIDAKKQANIIGGMVVTHNLQAANANRACAVSGKK